jgi:Na+-driven multidrug efflux pump
VYALSTGISPFVGQNFGAGRFDRIQEGMAFANRFCLAWGALLLAIFLLFGKAMATRFDPDPFVIDAASRYLWILAVSLGLRGIHNITWTSLNVLSRPYDAMALELLLAFALWIPPALVGAHFGRLSGLYMGLTLANILAGLAAWFWMRRIISTCLKANAYRFIKITVTHTNPVSLGVKTVSSHTATICMIFPIRGPATTPASR